MNNRRDNLSFYGWDDDDDGNNEEFSEWAEDFFSGYLYDPDYKHLEKDCKRSFNHFLYDIDKQIDFMACLSSEQLEALVSKIIQYRHWVDEQTGSRLARILAKIHGIDD